ncbi:11933_t:CDS:2, partial [Funneliformis geosporum]
MIDSILNQKKNTIILDRLLINDPVTGNKHFTIDPNEIKEQFEVLDICPKSCPKS